MVIYIIHIPFAYFGLWFFRSGEVKPKLCYRRLIRKINLDTKHCLRSIMNLKQATISSDKKKSIGKLKLITVWLLACLLMLGHVLQQSIALLLLLLGSFSLVLASSCIIDQHGRPALSSLNIIMHICSCKLVRSNVLIIRQMVEHTAPSPPSKVGSPVQRYPGGI